jgi:hypothetical protein
MTASNTVAISLALGLGLTGAFGAAANAQQSPQQNCAPRADIVDRLAQGYQETQIGVGFVNETTITEVYKSESGSFTFINTDPQGNSCMMASGHNMTAVSPAIDFENITQELTPMQQSTFNRLAMMTRGTCREMSAMFNFLNETYQEVPILAGISGPARTIFVLDTPDGALKPDGSPSDDGWSVVQVSMNPQIEALQACIVSGGTNWENVEPEDIPQGIDVRYQPSLP